MILLNNMDLFKPINGYEFLYAIDSLGNVKSLKNNKILKQSNHKKYCKIGLSKNGIQKHYFTHRLVWEAFIGKIPNKIQVNHKNGIKNDNRLENLELVTASENQIHSFRVLGRKAIKGGDHKKSKTVINIENGIYYGSISEAAKSLNMRYATLSAQLNGQNKNKTNIRLLNN